MSSVAALGVRIVALIYLVVGIVGFFELDALNPIHDHGVGARYLLNLVAINGIHNAIHVAIGVTGLVAVGNAAQRRWWCRLCGWALIVLFLAGAVQAAAEGFPRDQMFLGVVPLNSPGHVLHFVTGSVILYLGVLPADGTPEPGDPS